MVHPLCVYPGIHMPHTLVIPVTTLYLLKLTCMASCKGCVVFEAFLKSYHSVMVGNYMKACVIKTL